MCRALLFLSSLCVAQDLTDYKIEAVTSSHKFLEGPAWSAHDNTLLFSDIPKNVIHRLDPKGLTVFRRSRAARTETHSTTRVVYIVVRPTPAA